MKNHFLFVLFLFLFFTGCIKKYKFTAHACSGQLYAENFNINPAGVDATYLTDSLNFRMYVGKFDNEHENFRFICHGDSIIIEKISSLDTTGIMRVIERKFYNLKKLKSKRMFE
jgi:hypothetical protein